MQRSGHGTVEKEFAAHTAHLNLLAVAHTSPRPGHWTARGTRTSHHAIDTAASTTSRSGRGHRLPARSHGSGTRSLLRRR
jgi:hypothetical protein